MTLPLPPGPLLPLRRTPALLVVLALLLAAPPPAQGQGRTGWATSWENDSFVLFGGSDQAYTNGVRVVWSGRSSPERTFRGDLERAWGRLAWVGRFQSTTSAWTLGQNFFTPATISVYENPPGDRPYAGIAYGGLRLDATGLPSAFADAQVRPSGFSFTRQHSVELDVGVLGAASGDRLFQTFAHILRENRVPKGWNNQLPQEPFVGLNSMWRLRAGWHFLDVTPHVGANLSTVQSYPYAGATVRLGWNMSGFPSLLVRNTAEPEGERPDWEIALVAGVEGRAMGHNAFVEGGLRSDSEGVPAETFVGDLRFGLSLRVTDWRVSWTQVRRSPELDDETVPFRRYHDYGSLTFGFEPGRRTAADREGTVVGTIVDEWLGALFRGLLVQAATGPADAEGAVDALGSRMGVAKRLFGDRIALGGEVVGMAREFGPPPLPGGDHEDLFLVNKVVTLTWAPFGRLGTTGLQLRGGAGAGLRKRQVTYGVPGMRPESDPCPAGTVLDDADFRYCNGQDDGTGITLGAGYWFALSGGQASLGVDYAWNTVLLDDPLPDPRFAVVTFGFQWHPR